MKASTTGFLFAALISNIHSSGYFGYGVPVYLDQNTNTIQSYNPPFTGDGSLRSHSHGDAFAGNLKAQINANYPSISVSRVDRRDAAVTQSALVTDPNMQYYEMVFFSGHGWKAYPPGYYFGDAPGFITYEHGSLTPRNKSYGNWNRWVFTDFCQFLRDHTANDYAPMFNGLHAVFGYESDMWFYINGYNCFPWGCSGHDRSEDKWISFASNWAKPNGKRMWDDFKDINNYVQYVIGGQGNAPAVVYNFVLNWQGASAFIGSTEYITNVFNGDVPIGTLYHEYVSYGTPTY